MIFTASSPKSQISGTSASYSFELRNDSDASVTGVLALNPTIGGASSYTHTSAGSVGVTGLPVGAQTTALSATVVIPAQGFVLVSLVATVPALTGLAKSYSQVASWLQSGATNSLRAGFTVVQGDPKALEFKPNAVVNPDEVRRAFFDVDYESAEGARLLDRMNNTDLDLLSLFKQAFGL